MSSDTLQLEDIDRLSRMMKKRGKIWRKYKDGRSTELSDVSKHRRRMRIRIRERKVE